jgi:hypothetical protein
VGKVWLDFRRGAATLRARLGMRSAATGPRAGGQAGAPVQRRGGPARVPVLAGRSAAAGDTTRRGASDAWSFETPQDTTIDDFFDATQTSDPAYLDTTQVSHVLHRRR